MIDFLTGSEAAALLAEGTRVSLPPRQDLSSTVVLMKVESLTEVQRPPRGRLTWSRAPGMRTTKLLIY